MSRYVDAFLIPLPSQNVEQYKKIASQAGVIWKEHGALEYYECLADDLDCKDMVSFMRSADAKEGETVIIAWILYESKAKRDEVNAKVMADPRIANMMGPDTVPFDYKRMAYGGFTTLVEVR